MYYKVDVIIYMKKFKGYINYKNSIYKKNEKLKYEQSKILKLLSKKMIVLMTRFKYS